MTRLCALVLICLAVPAGRVAAAPRPPVSPAPVVPRIDGRTLAAWEAQPGIVNVLRDTQPLDAPATLVEPPDCHLSFMAVARIGLMCARVDPAGQLQLLDPATGAASDLPLAGPLAAATAKDHAGNREVDFVGTAVASVTASYDRVDVEELWRPDGTRVATPKLTPTRVPSLDDPRGFAGLCAPLRVGASRSRFTHHLHRDVAVYRRPWLATLHAGRVELRRCGSRRARILDRPRLSALRDPSLLLTGRYVAWRSRNHRVVVRRLADGATFRYGRDDLPGALSGPAYLLGTDHRLWIQNPTSRSYVIEIG